MIIPGYLKVFLDYGYSHWHWVWDNMVWPNTKFNLKLSIRPGWEMLR